MLDALSENDVRVILDLFGLTAGTYSIVPDVDIPDRGIEIRSVQPAAVTVTISQTVPSTASAFETPIVSDGEDSAVMAPTPVTRVPTFCYLSSSGMVSAGLQEICIGRRKAE